MYDYSLTVAPTEWEMKCGCGTVQCRKIISDIRSVPKEQLERYKELGALQDYMMALLKEAERDGWRIPDYELEILAKIKTACDQRASL